ncbi:MAG: LacI family DNA-binding transcriptional regulator [Bifidobacterium asteroides]
MSKASVYDVAREAGVSISTVSRSFTSPEKVSAKTRAKVMKAAEAMNFTVTHTAASLKTGRTFRAALLVGSERLDWFGSLVREGLDSILHPAGYDTSVYPIGDSEEQERFFAELPIRRNVDLVFVSSFDITSKETSRLNSINVPIIGINVESNHDLDGSVKINDTKGTKMAVNHLLALGHRNIAYMHISPKSPLHFSSLNRLQGFLAACRQWPEPVKTELIKLQPGQDVFSSFVSQIQSMESRPTALCCQDDSVAIPLLFKLNRFRLTVPGNLSLIGFDDSTYADKIGLTTIHQDPFDLGAKAGSLALELLKKTPPKNPYITLDTQIMIRNTTAPIEDTRPLDEWACNS